MWIITKAFFVFFCKESGIHVGYNKPCITMQLLLAILTDRMFSKDHGSHLFVSVLYSTYGEQYVFKICHLVFGLGIRSEECTFVATYFTIVVCMLRRCLKHVLLNSPDFS